LARMLANKILAVAAIGLVVLSLVNSVGGLQTMERRRSDLRDRFFIAAMRDLSRLIPDGAHIVVSANAPQVQYFTGHRAGIPYPVTSMDALIDYMRVRGIIFLVVFEGDSNVAALKTLFSSKGVKTLETAFVQLAVYRTDIFIIRVYQMK